MKRLLFVIPTLRMGGAEKALVSLLKRLDPNKVQADLFLFERGGILEEQVPTWVQILPEDDITKAMTLEFRLYWKELVKRGKLKLAAARLQMLLNGMVGARLRGTPGFSWSISSKYVDRQGKLYDTAISFLEGTSAFYVIDKVSAGKKICWIHTDFKDHRLIDEEKGYYQQFDEIITITEACRASFQQAVSFTPNHLHVVENISIPEEIISMAECPFSDSWDPQFKHLLTVARLEYQKGIDLALKACKVLSGSRSDFKWHVFGAGSMKPSLKKEIKESNLQDIFFLDGVKSNPYPFMKAAYALVQPSRVEGKSIVLDEAKILGKAILTTNYPSVADQLTDGITGMIVEMNPNAIAAGINRLLDDEEYVGQLEQNCISQVSNSSPVLDRFYQIIESE